MIGASKNERAFADAIADATSLALDAREAARAAAKIPISVRRHREVNGAVSALDRATSLLFSAVNGPEPPCHPPHQLTLV